MRIFASVVLVVCGFSTVFSQQSKHKEIDYFVVVPRNIVMPLIAVQPDCPLQFEKIERLARIGGGGANTFRLRNRSAKPILNFRVSYLLGNGNGGSWGWENNRSRLVVPGEVVPNTLQNSSEEVVPLSEDIRDKLELRGPMKTMIIYFVEWVEFSDGTTYSDEATYKALQLHLENLGDKSLPKEPAIWRKKF